MKRVCTILLTLVLLMSLLPIAAVSAAEKEIVLLAGSDFQVSSHNTTRIEQVLNTLEIHGISKADGAFFCGDYTLNSVDENQGQSTQGISVLKRLFTPIVGNRMTFVQGNHDPEDAVGLSRSGNNDPASMKYGVYVIHEDEYLQYNWDYSQGVTEKTAANLKKYLDEKSKTGWNKPIFVLSHVGLHWGNRTIKEGSAIHGSLLVDVLNEAGEKGLNIIFLYGHDHSGGWGDSLGGSAVYFKKGDRIEVSNGQKTGHVTRTLKFTYMNAGYIGYYSTNEPTTDATVTMSVFRIKGNEVIITRYDGNVDLENKQYGIHNLKSAGVWYPDYSQKGYHAEPYTQVYASSRKVTATADVPVDTPIPTKMTNPTEATESVTTRGSVVAVQKPSADKGKNTTAKQQGTSPTALNTTAPEDAPGDNNAVAEPSNNVETESPKPSGETSDDSTPTAGEGIPGWVWIFPIAGGVLLLGSIVVLILTLGKKKAK